MGMFDEDYFEQYEGWGDGEPDIIYEGVTKEHETELALLLWIDGKKYWIPKSICMYDEESEELGIPYWFEKKMVPVE